MSSRSLTTSNGNETTSRLRKSTLSLAVSAAVAGSLVGTPAFAQPNESAFIEEVVVTATRRSVSAKEIPYNISALSGDTLADAGVSDIGDLGNIVPGLSITDAGARTGFISNGVVIRGLNGIDTSLMHSPVKVVSPVAIYLNDTPVYANIQFTDVERVEVLRGPQGTLYGSGSVGGTVKYVMATPDTEGFDASGSFGVGMTDGANSPNTSVEGMVNFAIANNFAIRANVKHVKEAGTINYSNIYALNDLGEPVLTTPTDIVGSTAQTQTVKNADDSDSLFARVSVLWDASESITAKLNLFHQENDMDASSNESVALGNGSGESSKLILEPFSGETDMASIEVAADLGFASLTSVTSYYETTNKGTFDLTGQYTGFSFYPEYYGSSPRPLIVDKSLRDEDAIIQEFRLVSQTDGAIEWLVGAFYMKQEGDTNTEQSFPGYHDYSSACFGAGNPSGGVPCGFGTFFGDPAVAGTPAAIKDLAYLTNFQDEFEDMALFGEVTWHILDNLDLTGGVRVFDQEYSLDEQGGLAFANSLSDESNSLSANDELYKLNISYQYNEDHQLYATYSEGFRRGGANALGDLGTAEISTFVPDRLDNMEIGLKGILHERIEYTLSYFTAEWDDLQIRSNCTDLALICTVNAGDAETKGVELEANAMLSEKLQLRFGYTHLATKLVEASDSADINFAPGAKLAGAPANSANLALIYSSDLENGMALDGFLSASYKGERVGNLPNIAAGEQLVELEAYYSVDTSVALTSDSWTAKLFVNNVTNSDAWVSQADPSLWQTGAYAGIQRPRTVGMSIGYDF